MSAQAKLNVVLVDQNDQILQKAQDRIQKSLARVAKKKFADNPAGGDSFVKDVVGKIRLESNLAKAVKDSDLVIEAIVENIQVKQKLFADIEANVKR